MEFNGLQQKIEQVGEVTEQLLGLQQKIEQVGEVTEQLLVLQIQSFVL